jgi:RNA polymerase sigma-B factor
VSTLAPRGLDRLSDDEVLEIYHLERDPLAREELVKRFLPFARKLALRYVRSREPLDDLVQVASVGLLNAIERFEPGRGKKFTSFAAPTIVGELKRHFRDKGWTVHVPRDLQERALAVSRHTERLSALHGRSPRLDELAEALAARWSTLSAVEREVLSLRLVYELTQREISQRIGCSQMHVSRLLRRSMNRLEAEATAS